MIIFLFCSYIPCKPLTFIVFAQSNTKTFQLIVCVFGVNRSKQAKKKAEKSWTN